MTRRCGSATVAKSGMNFEQYVIIPTNALTSGVFSGCFAFENESTLESSGAIPCFDSTCPNACYLRYVELGLFFIQCQSSLAQTFEHPFEPSSMFGFVASMDDQTVGVYY